jgi:hypothetical protein
MALAIALTGSAWFTGGSAMAAIYPYLRGWSTVRRATVRP